MPKIVDKAKMRDTILDAAMTVFAEHGIHASSVSDIALAAGLAKGTLYLYFDSKEAMTTAIVDRHFAALEAQIACGAPGETLNGFLEDLRRTMDIPTEQSSFHRVFFEVFGPSFASDAFTSHVAGFFDRLGAHYAERITRLQDLGEITPHHHAPSIGRVLASMMDGVVLHRGLFDIAEPRHQRMIREAVAVLGDGLRPLPPGPE
ncbi:TetR/AcrR family transcriptional regulator [Roseobacter sp.]|uniref:TetR/AcrR family transcriptional regulator n=1 Tax=Roseobacter sp. TaxID=1907202 RepID=UPI002966255F|nr:TetR/AcrR family transcriptional regulator [Roseobacter sp.]MDW3181597.1 TetR/AcrR family transcriptional regulator [Roseobacter sp.]